VQEDDVTRMERYNDRRSRRVCVDCGAKPARRKRVRCRGCCRKGARASQRWIRRNRKRDREQRLHRIESIRLSNPELYRADLKARRCQKKNNGICVDCPRIAVEGRVRCRRCLDLNVVYAMRTKKRRKRQEEIEIAAYRPLDAVIDLTRVRLLRAARWLNWFATQELTEMLGPKDGRERNTLTQALSRMARTGEFQRRKTLHGLLGMTGGGSPYEYRITQRGIDEIDALLRGRGLTRNYRMWRVA
jgi:hypothetical protein